MIFEKATTKDAPLLANAMRQIRASMADPTMYVIDTEDDIRHSIDGIHGFALLAKEEEELAGFFIFRYPDIEEEDHLGAYLNLDETEKKSVVYMDSVAVFPKFRGQGLQKQLLLEGEKILRDTSYSTALATVSPDNPASLNTLLGAGFQIIATAPKYSGLLRHVLYKDLTV